MNIINEPPYQGQEYSHASVLTQREEQYRLSEMYKELGMNKKADRAAACRNMVEIILEGDGERRFCYLNHCNLKGCSPCARRQAYNNAKLYLPEVQQVFKRSNAAQFLTLTRTNVARLDRCYVNKTWNAYKKLLRRDSGRLFCATIASMETPVGYKGWHPHIHTIVFGKRIPEWELQREWAELTGDHHVTVRPIGYSELNGKLLYFAKPTQIANSAQLKEYIDATARVNMFRPTGDLYGLKLREKARKRDSYKARFRAIVNSTSPLIARFLAGEDVEKIGAQVSRHEWIN
jgi:hypothetical protein